MHDWFFLALFAGIGFCFYDMGYVGCLSRIKRVGRFMYIFSFLLFVFILIFST